jgi:hypothetical protein
LRGVKRLLAIAILLGGTSPALGWPSLFTAPPPQKPHPAVVRVIVPERDGASLGSGSLVAVGPRHGLVITNWHVVRDQAGTIEVVFPDGFRSPAALLKVDKDWDLAALAIWRPSVQPIALSRDPPKPGETLTIAGYGGGPYRASTGHCTEYLSPGGRLPFEMVEVDTGARFGDSGGPILNQRGEMAGVLFGSAMGKTAGSYCGRVSAFLAPLGDFRREADTRTVIAQQPPVAAPPPAAINTTPTVRPAAETAMTTAAGAPGNVVAGMAVTPPPAATSAMVPPPIYSPTVPAASTLAATGPAITGPAATATIPTRGEQIKTILAAVGVLALLFHGIRLIGSAAG